MENKATETTVEETTVERAYTLRRLKDKDLWVVLHIISEVFPDDLATIVMDISTKKKTMAEIGSLAVMRIVSSVVKNIGKIHDELYDFLSDVSGIPAKDIEEMEFGTTPMMIYDIVSNEKNAGFFTVLSKLQ